MFLRGTVSLLFLVVVTKGFLNTINYKGYNEGLPSKDTSPLDCDFEDQLCGWTQDNNKKWHSTSKEKVFDSRRRYAPVSDHTLGNQLGNYLTIDDPYHRWRTQRYKVISPRMAVAENGICFKFWYYMHGPAVSDLSIFVTKTSDQEKPRLVWKRSGTQGPHWRYSQIHIQDITGEAYISIETVAEKGSKSNHPALDDFSMNHGHCPQSNSCDFEDGSCSFTWPQKGDSYWNIASSNTIKNQTGPKIDHTFETSVGHYAYIHHTLPPKSRVAGTKALLFTNRFPATPSSCFSFWYNMEVASKSTLNIRLNSSQSGEEIDKNEILLTKSGHQIGGWIFANVAVSSSVDYNIAFEGIDRSGSQGTIALDDIRVKPGLCPELGRCDFEEETCPWRNVREGDNFDWELVQADHIAGLPGADHTLHTPYGKYIYLDTSERSNGDVAKYISPPLDKGKIYCLNFWYYSFMEGDLSIVTQDAVTKIESGVSFNTTEKEKVWFPVRKSLGPIQNEFNVIIIAKMSAKYKSKAIIGIDDISIQKGSCESLPSPQQTKNAFMCQEKKFISQRELCDFHQDCMHGEDEQTCGYNCDFENGTTCGWTLSSKPGSYWEVQNGTSSQKEGGPVLDTTFNTTNGHYLYLKKRHGSEKALLLSPLLQKSAPACELTFSFFYNNVNYGDFNVRKVVGFGKSVLYNPSPLANNGEKWQKITLPIGLTEVPFRIEIIGSKYMNHEASIAVDDIQFRNCDFPHPYASCTTTDKFQCKNKACVEKATVCNFIDNCGDWSDEGNETCASYHRCNFESGSCLWSQERFEDDLDWKLDDSIIHRFRYGPSVDHTTFTESGHHMYIDSSKRDLLPGDKAWLLSPVFESKSLCKLTLYLHMNGEGDDQHFSVYTRSEIDGFLTRVFTKIGESSTTWLSVNIELKSVTKFQIVIEGVSGSLSRGSIAVDDLVLSPSCVLTSNTLPTSQKTPSTTSSPLCENGKQWPCSDGSQCIDRSELCDFVAQCNDRSDEKDCGACDFESSMCGWRDRTRGKYFWERVNTSSIVREDEPKTDHTHAGKTIGSYAHINSKGYGYIRPVILESPIFGSTGAGCLMSFYYQYPRNIMGHASLQLYPKQIESYERANGEVLWTSKVEKTTWTNHNVNIGSRLAGFRIVFKFTQGIRTSNYFVSALDDISFSSDCGMGKPSGMCKLGEFLCWQSGECKSIAARCDLAKDCKNGEDEENCLKYTTYNFEHGLKNFENYHRDISFYWTLREASSFFDESAPDRDHTFGNKTGHYIYIAKAASSSASLDVARLKGPVMLGNKEGTCRMRLFYHLNGNYKDAINVYTETRNGGMLKPVWSKHDGVGNEWKRADILLDEKTLFRVIIEGVRVTDYRGGIGIDDISFTPQCIIADGKSLPPNIPQPSHGSCKQGMEFPCDGKCMSLNKWCDFQVDCQDGSDEKSCPSHCGFEGGMCGWKTSTNEGKADWKPVLDKNDVDNNPGFAGGYILKTKTLGYKEKVILESPFFKRSSPNCSFSFWFKHQDSRQISITLKRKYFDNEEDLFSRNLRKSITKWEQETVLLPSCAMGFQLIFTITPSFKSLPFMMDSFSFNGCGLDLPNDGCNPGEFQCRNGLCIPENRVCDLGNDCCDNSDEDSALCYKYRKDTFEYGMGGWKRITGIRTWKLSENGDHTFSLFSGGKYIYTPCRETHSIIVHEMPAPNELCVIRFWHRFDFGNGQINVKVRTHLSDSTTVASFIGHEKIKGLWMRAEVKINLKEAYLLMLEGVCNFRGPGISIDDIVFSPSCNNAPLQPSLSTTSTSLPTKRSATSGNCSSFEQFECLTDVHCIPEHKVCDFNFDCPDKSDEAGCSTTSLCDFDSDLCGWQISQSDDLFWVRGLSSRAGANMGPRFDASGVIGNYVYIESSKKLGHQNQTPQLSSKRFPHVAAGCAIEFYYFLSGPNPGILSLRIIYGPDNMATLWKTSRQSDNWIKVIIGVGRRTSDFNLAFVREPDSALFRGQIAIDKMRFLASCWELPDEGKECRNTDTMYQCTRGACVLKSQLCDGQDDCGDKSDESSQLCENFTQVNFESLTSPFGSLTQSSDNDLDWLVWNGAGAIPNGLLGVDHSIGLPQGQYLYVNGYPEMKRTDSAWLLSEPFEATSVSSGCEVRFFVIIPSPQQSLQVGYRIYNSTQRIAYKETKVNIFGSYWQQVGFNFNDVNQPFQIVFKASPGFPDGSLAIDDITFGPYCRPYKSAVISTPSATYDVTDQSLLKTGGNSDGEWKTPVGVTIGLLAIAALVTGVVFYLHKTGRIVGIRMQFGQLRNEYSPSKEWSRSHSNPVYYDGSTGVVVDCTSTT